MSFRTFRSAHHITIIPMKARILITELAVSFPVLAAIIERAQAHIAVSVRVRSPSSRNANKA